MIHLANITTTLGHFFQCGAALTFLLTGGDWGSMLSKALGLFHSEHCKGIHLNMLTAPPRPYNPWHMLQAANAMLPYMDRFPTFATAEEISWLKDTFHFQKEETGKLQRILSA